MKNSENKLKFISKLIMLFLFLIPMDTFNFIPGFSLLKIIALVIIFVSIFYIKDLSKIKINIVILSLLFFVIYSAFQLLYTPYILTVKTKTFSIIMYFFMIVVIAQINFNENEKRMFIKSFCFSSFLALIFMLVFPYNYEGRTTICFPNMKYEDPNQLCGYLIPGMVYCLDLILSKKKIIIHFILFCFLLYFSLLTGSRGGLIGVLFAIIVTVLLFKKNNKSVNFISLIRRLLLLLILFLIFSVCLNFLSSDLFSRFSISSVLESGGTGRTDIWKFYFDYFRDSSLFYKLFGYGSGSLPSIYRVAHNTWIELLLESGIFGLLLFLIFFVNVVFISLKYNSNAYKGIVFGIIGLTFSLSLMAYKPIWVIIIISTLNCNIIRKENKNEK